MIIVIVLAAGTRTRFGSDKRRSLLPNGIGVLDQTIVNARSTVYRCLSVLRATDQQFVENLGRRFILAEMAFYLAPDSAAGMAHSLANLIG